MSGPGPGADAPAVDEPDAGDGPTDSERPAESAGYILPTTALLMLPLMIFAALAVDVGSWYAEAAQAQKAADAAALAGVPLLATEAEAIAVAKDVAARNGYVDQPGCDVLPCTPTAFPQVVVTRLALNQLRVDIFTTADMMFGRVVSDEPVEIERSGTAEHAPQVPLGNPTSTLGSATDVASGGYVPNYWLRASSDCEGRATGDFIGAGGGCPNTNPNHRDEGHTFIVDVPVAGSYVLQARTSCFERGGAQANASMRFRVFPADTTPLDDDDNTTLPPMADVTVDRPGTDICPADGSGWSRNYDPAPWVTITNLSNAGRYVMQAKNPAPTANVRSLYSLRVVPASQAGAYNYSCSRVGAAGSSGCPNILAKDYLTTLTAAEMFPSGSVGKTEVFLAEIAEFYAGETMRIELFDPADGIDVVRIVDPNGNYVDFSWYSVDCSLYNYRCGRGDYGTKASPITQTCSGTPCISQKDGYSFQDRTAMLEIPLPSDYSCAAPSGQPPDCWWRVEYEDNNSSVIDTTTWGVTILGDPVHLID
ncbi:MAG: pilus assembly protein TadG-related protein [Actinomycetota bacterium]